MVEITLRVIDGADRGRVYHGLNPPVTIGREEGNSIQLNDDRVSRFHVKIQEDNNRIVLTDLESTNGTKVNGEDIQLRILRYGDVISLGRSVLVYGSREQIAHRIRELKKLNGESSRSEGTSDVSEGSSLDIELDPRPDALPLPLPWTTPPELPDRLSPAQAAQLCEIIEYIHHRIRHLLATVKPTGNTGRITLEFDKWQELVDLQTRLSEYIRLIGDPEI